jgi:hypothetical protein
VAVFEAMGGGDVAIVQHKGARGEQGAVIAVRDYEDAEDDQQEGKGVHGWVGTSRKDDIAWTKYINVIDDRVSWQNSLRLTDPASNNAP